MEFCCVMFQWLSLPFRAELFLDVAVKETEKAESCRGLHLPVKLFHNDLLHPHHVRHSKAPLTDADQVIGQRNILLLFWGLHCNIEAAQAHTGQMLWLNLWRSGNIILFYDKCLYKDRQVNECFRNLCIYKPSLLRGIDLASWWPEKRCLSWNQRIWSEKASPSPPAPSVWWSSWGHCPERSRWASSRSALVGIGPPDPSWLSAELQRAVLQVL